jgi:hypothetical protein
MIGQCRLDVSRRSQQRPVIGCFKHMCSTLGRPKATAVYATARGFGPRKGTGCTSDCVGREEQTFVLGSYSAVWHCHCEGRATKCVHSLG